MRCVFIISIIMFIVVWTNLYINFIGWKMNKENDEGTRQSSTSCNDR